jgi:hypothetical protein
VGSVMTFFMNQILMAFSATAVISSALFIGIPPEKLKCWTI